MHSIHLKAPKGWINDPNGFIYYKGKYHLFYQHFPYAPKWGRMHWGHAVSDDMTDWEHLDIALFPTKNDDSDGCFSGSAVEENGKMHLFYTGVHYTEPDPENINCCLNDNFISSQLHISSENGFDFDNFDGKKTVIPPITEPEIGNKIHTRDPKVWKGNDGNWYMILGSTADHKGRVLFYRSSDLMHWQYMNYATCNDMGWMWECPDYFETDGKGVLIFSPMDETNGNQSICTLADFNEGNCTMKIHENFRYLDYGLDLYAPQSTTDKDGRRVVVAWLRMPEPMENGVIGMFSIPRLCEVKNGHIYFRPHPNIAGKFSVKTNSPDMNKPFVIKTELADNESVSIGGYIVKRENRKIITDRNAVIRGHKELKSICETPELKDGSSLEIYVDENIIEVFVNNGEYVISNAVYDLADEIICNENTEIYGLEE